MKTNRMIKQISFLALVAGWLSAPGLASGADPSSAVTKTTALPPKVPGKERVAKITLTEITAVAAQKGWLQEEYAKVNAKFELVNISSYGIVGVEASLLDRGDLHITSRMAYPALQHLANGLDGEFIWQSRNPHPYRVTVSVLADSDIHTVADLKGKKFGSSLIGCPYYASREAFKAQGLDVDTDFQKGDIRFVNITGAASTSAFLAGRIDSLGTHPAVAAQAELYLQHQVRDIATALPDGAYVTGGGRTAYFAMRKWAQANPDLVKAYLTAYIRTVRWLNSDNGAHLEEAAQIAAREVREPKEVARYDLTVNGTIAWDYGQTDYQNAVDSIKQFQKYAISIKDPFFTKHHLSDQEIEARVDKRFFAGGEYFVDTSAPPQANATRADAGTPANAATGAVLATVLKPQ